MYLCLRNFPNVTDLPSCYVFENGRVILEECDVPGCNGTSFVLSFKKGHPTTYFSKSCIINLKPHYNYEQQQNNGFWTLKVFSKKQITRY